MQNILVKKETFMTETCNQARSQQVKEKFHIQKLCHMIQRIERYVQLTLISYTSHNAFQS